MTQPGRCWPRKHEDQSSEPNTLGKLSRRHSSVNLCTGECRRQRQANSWMLAIWSRLLHTSSVRKLVSDTKVEIYKKDIQHKPLASVCTCVHMQNIHTDRHTQTHRHTHGHTYTLNRFTKHLEK